MAKKNNRNNKKNKPKRNATNNNSVPSLGPMIKSAVASGLRTGGAALGSMVAGPAGAGVGRNVGAWVSKLIGSGDYTVVENSLIRGSAHGVPTFNITGHSVRIKHREYLGDITGSTAFSSRAYLLQPGSTVTFPWLSQIAKGFQQYKFHGLVFCFNSTSASALNSTNTALGTLIMATQYNVNRPTFTSKMEMEGYEFSCATKPSESLMHPIECDPKQLVMEDLYIRSGAVPSNEDARLYDMGKFQVATVGMQAAANIGELWVTYDIELLKPRLPPGGDFGGEYTRVNNGSYTNTDMLGSIQTTPRGNLGIQIASNGAWNRIFFPNNLVTGKYFVWVRWVGSTAVAVNVPAPTYTNLTLANAFSGGGGWHLTPITGTSSTSVSYTAVLTINGYNADGSYIEFSGVTLPTGSGQVVDIYVIELPMSDDFI